LTKKKSQKDKTNLQLNGPETEIKAGFWSEWFKRKIEELKQRLKANEEDTKVEDDSKEPSENKKIPSNKTEEPKPIKEEIIVIPNDESPPITNKSEIKSSRNALSIWQRFKKKAIVTGLVALGAAAYYKMKRPKNPSQMPRNRFISRVKNAGKWIGLAGLSFCGLNKEKCLRFAKKVWPFKKSDRRLKNNSIDSAVKVDYGTQRMVDDKSKIKIHPVQERKRQKMRQKSQFMPVREQVSLISGPLL
jgi:hypothetical protein